MRKVWFISLLMVLVITACGPKESLLETDSGLSYKDVPQSVQETVKQTTIVHLAVRIVQEQITAQYQLAPAAGSSWSYKGTGSGEYTGQIIEGKGILLVNIINGPDEYLGTAILKFVDLKAMALRPGFIARVSCVVDYELLNPAQNKTEYTDDALTYELDDCRLGTPFVTTQEE